MIRARLAAFALLLSLTPCETAAAADNGPWLPKAQGNRLGLAFDWWPNHRSFAWGITGQILLNRVMYFDADMPWAASTDNPRYHGPEFADCSLDRETAVIVGNPSIGAHWADTNSKIAGFAGAMLSVSYHSNTTRPTGCYVDFVDRDAVWARAYADLHRFAPEHFFIHWRGGIELRILPMLFYRVELTPIVAIPIDSMRSDTYFAMGIHNEMEARASIGVGGGMHLQAVFLAGKAEELEGSSEHDAVHTAMEPYFIYEPIRGFYARAGVLVALDETLGFGFNRNKVATVRVALGGKW